MASPPPQVVAVSPQQQKLSPIRTQSPLQKVPSGSRLTASRSGKRRTVDLDMMEASNCEDPVLALRASISRIHAGLEDTHRRPRTASPLLSYSEQKLPKCRELGKAGVFVAATVDEGRVLARPLTAGWQYAAAVATFDVLADRNLLDVDDDNKVRLSESDVARVYEAKCYDQKCAPNFERMKRFHELLCSTCTGTWFAMRQCGLGARCCEVICDVLEKDSHYNHLDLSGNDLGNGGAASIAKLLLRNDSLCVLRLQSVDFSTGLLPIFEALNTNNTLTALDLSGISGVHRNTVWGQSAKALATTLQTNTVLSHLNLASCGVSRNASLIARSCAAHCALTYLNLSGNSIGDEAAEAIFRLLSEGQCSLKTLELSHNNIGCSGLERICAGLHNARGIAGSSLEVLALSHNRFCARGLQALATALREHPALQRVDLSSNCLTCMGTDEDGYKLPPSIQATRYLFSCLSNNSHITELLMSNCQLTSLPADSLQEMMSRSPTLTSIDLSSNAFGDGGAEVLGAALLANRHLQTLCVKNCGITTGGGSKLAKAIETHPALQSLLIRQGNMDVQAAGLVAALRQNASVISTDFTSDAREAAIPFLHRNKRLRIQNAGPELQRKLRALDDEERAFAHTEDLIREEQHRREKATEAFKTFRDKQKATTNNFKVELQDLAEQVERSAQGLKVIEQQQIQTEEKQAAQQRQWESELARLKKKIEGTVATKNELLRATAKARQKIDQEEIDSGLFALKAQLKGVQEEVGELTNSCGVLEKRLADYEKRLLFLSSSTSKGGKGGKGPSSRPQSSQSKRASTSSRPSSRAQSRASSAAKKSK